MALWKCIIPMLYKLILLGQENFPAEYVGNRYKTFHLREIFYCGNQKFDI